MELYAHQVTGVEWLHRQTRALLSDEQGLGKSPTAIVAAQQAGCKRVLVIAPTVVAWNWQRELQRWWPGTPVGMLTSSIAAASALQSPVVVTTHGLLIQPATYKKLCGVEWDLVILDEAHYFRNEDAQRTRAFYGADGIIHHTKRVWLLTGTPMPNHAGELWPMLRGLWPERCPYSYEQFREKFCQLEWSTFKTDWKVVGNKDVAGLKAMLAGTFLRRLKKDHLDLPAIRWETMVLPRPGRAPELDAFERALPKGIEGEALLDWLRANTEFAHWRRLCGLAKIEPAAELLQMELEGTDHKVVVFAHHLDVLQGLEDALGADNVVTITGSVSAYERTKRVALFQEDPSVRVALCQIQAAGTGITMHAAAEVVFVEQSFVPGENAQAADRVHRIGQKQQVRARFLSLAGTVDQLVAEALARKQQSISEILGEH